MKGFYPYPVETLKNWYVTLVGGQSRDLKPGQIGLNQEALAENTELVPYRDRVLVSKLEGGRIQPLFTKKYFTVVPLDEASPDALSKSPKGEAVLPRQERKRNRFLEPFQVGDTVILNSVLSQRFPEGFVRRFDGLIQKRSGMPSLKYGDN